MKLKDLIEVVDIEESIDVIVLNLGRFIFKEGISEIEKINFIEVFGDYEVHRIYAENIDFITIEIEPIEKGE